MATELTNRILGTAEPFTPATIDIVISDATLLGASDEPAILLADDGRKNMGTLTATQARTLIKNAVEHNAAWVQWLYATPTGALVATSQRTRCYTGSLARAIRLRDQGTCREAGCDAAIVHTDHVIPVAAGGETTMHNGQGLCVRHNYAKEAEGWTSTPTTDPATNRHAVITTGPDGETSVSVAPSLPKPFGAPSSPDSAVPKRQARLGVSGSHTPISENTESSPDPPQQAWPDSHPPPGG